MVSIKVLNRNLRVNSGTGRLIHSTNAFYIQKVTYYWMIYERVLVQYLK